MTKNFLISGASTYGVKNAGDDAMLATLSQGLHERFPGSVLTFLARHPDASYDEAFGIRSIKNFDHDTREQSVGRWFWGFNRGDSGTHLHRIREAMVASDLVVIGGNSFMEVSKNEFMRGVSSYSALLAQLSIFFEKPYVLYGLAVVDHIRDPYTQQVARFVCRNARLITARERSTVDYLADIGVPGDNIRICGDPAFGIRSMHDATHARRLLAQEGIRLQGRPLVGLSFRHEYWKWSDREFDEYASKIARLCDHYIETQQAEMLFIPNCTYAHGHRYQDDRVVTEIIVAKMKHPEFAHQLRGDYLVFDTLSLFNLLDLHVSNRRHSCIFAALHGVPFIAISISFQGHIHPFMEELGVPEQILSLSADRRAMFEIADRSWDNRRHISERLAAAIPRLQAKAREQVGLLAGVA